MPRRFRIHPAIGVARVGNSSDSHFIGPEHPGVPANWDPAAAAFRSFRDASGKVKRQAARFRVFEYTEDAQGGLSAPKEVTIGGGIADIEWRVHIANRKASFFLFDGQRGAKDLFRARSKGTAEKNLRNAAVVAKERARQLDIDPGEQLISKARPGPVVLKNPNTRVPFIPDLGELHLDEDGRLLVLGGHGTSGSTKRRKIEEYANNDTWFDDVGDGSVKARVRLADGTTIDADPAWVLVGPPDFVPGVGNAVSLWDTLWDLSVRKLTLPQNTLFKETGLRELAEQKTKWFANNEGSLLGYRPSFLLDVYPLLARALAVRQLYDPGEMDRGSFHVQLADWQTLAGADSGKASDEGRRARQEIFKRIRNPGSNRADWTEMPRGWGDDYVDGVPTATGYVSLTRIQYALLEQWQLGNFKSDWPGAEPPVPAPGPITPDGLDRAALENCVGGPFFPGIEVSWLVREPTLYGEPFRLKALRVPEAEALNGFAKAGALEFRPGFFSQQMALPWQADFYDCHKEEREMPDDKKYLFMWWTAQRPDDVYTAGEKEQVPWTRSLAPPGQTFDDFEGTPERFARMAEDWWKLHFIIPKNGRFEEEELGAGTT